MGVFSMVESLFFMVFGFAMRWIAFFLVAMGFWLTLLVLQEKTAQALVLNFLSQNVQQLDALMLFSVMFSFVITIAIYISNPSLLQERYFLKTYKNKINDQTPQKKEIL